MLHQESIYVPFSNFATDYSQEISDARNRTLNIINLYLNMYTTEDNDNNALQYAKDQALNIQHRNRIRRDTF